MLCVQVLTTRPETFVILALILAVLELFDFLVACLYLDLFRSKERRRVQFDPIPPHPFTGNRRIAPTQNCIHEINNVFMMLILG